MNEKKVTFLYKLTYPIGILSIIALLVVLNDLCGENFGFAFFGALFGAMVIMGIWLVVIGAVTGIKSDEYFSWYANMKRKNIEQEKKQGDNTSSRESVCTVGTQNEKESLDGKFTVYCSPRKKEEDGRVFYRLFSVHAYLSSDGYVQEKQTVWYTKDINELDVSVYYLDGERIDGGNMWGNHSWRMKEATREDVCRIANKYQISLIFQKNEPIVAKSVEYIKETVLNAAEKENKLKEAEAISFGKYDENKDGIIRIDDNWFYYEQVDDRGRLCMRGPMTYKEIIGWAGYQLNIDAIYKKDITEERDRTLLRSFQYFSSRELKKNDRKNELEETYGMEEAKKQMGDFKLEIK